MSSSKALACAIGCAGSPFSQPQSWSSTDHCVSAWLQYPPLNSSKSCTQSHRHLPKRLLFLHPCRSAGSSVLPGDHIPKSSSCHIKPFLIHSYLQLFSNNSPLTSPSLTWPSHGAWPALVMLIPALPSLFVL